MNEYVTKFFALLLLILVFFEGYCQKDKTDYLNISDIIEASKRDDDFSEKHLKEIIISLYKEDFLKYKVPDTLANSLLILAKKAYKNHRFSIIDSLVQMADTLYAITKNKNRMSTLTMLCKIGYRQNNFDQAEKSGKKAVLIAKEYNDTIAYIDALSNLSNAYYNSGDLFKSVEIDFELAKIHEKCDDSLNLCISTLNIAKTYADLEDYDKAISTYKNALQIAIDIRDSISIADVYNDLGTVYFHLSQHNKAEKYLISAIEILDQIGDSIQTAISLLNYGDLLIHRGDFDQGFKRLNHSLEIITKINDHYLLTNVYTSIGNAYWDLGKYDLSEEYHKKALQQSIISNNIHHRKKILKSLYFMYEQAGNYNIAFYYIKEYYTLKDSLENIEIVNQLNQLQTEYDTYKSKQEILRLNNEKELSQSQQNLLIAIIFIIIIIFFVITVVILIKRKKDKEVHHQKELYHRKEKELAKSELEKSRIKEEELNKSIRYKSKQISTHALHMMQKNKILGDISNELKTLYGSIVKEENQKFQNIIRQINNSLRLDKDWDVFKLYFEEINKDFYTKLYNVNPNLTTNDHRLCALIKLNMSSKEMASVLNVAPNSIKSSRYRLKKKLGLDADADLEEYIRNF